MGFRAPLVPFGYRRARNLPVELLPLAGFGWRISYLMILIELKVWRHIEIQSNKKCFLIIFISTSGLRVCAFVRETRALALHLLSSRWAQSRKLFRKYVHYLFFSPTQMLLGKRNGAPKKRRKNRRPRGRERDEIGIFAFAIFVVGKRSKREDEKRSLFLRGLNRSITFLHYLLIRK